MTFLAYFSVYLLIGMAYTLATYRFGYHVDDFIRNKAGTKRSWADIAKLSTSIVLWTCVMWVAIVLWTIFEKFFKFVGTIFGMLWLWICTQLYLRSKRGTK